MPSSSRAAAFSVIYGGVNNLTNAQPYLSSSAYPVSGVGGLFFLGILTKL